VRHVSAPDVNGGAALVAALKRNGVDVVFGIPGVHNFEIYRHLSGSSIAHVAVRHEQAAAYAADGFARSSGRPGVCLTTSGPGITNACTGAATAYADSIPVLLCSPGPPLGAEGLDLGLLHEMKDEHAHLDSLVTASVRPASPEEIGEVIDEVFHGWRRARRRPVHVELPIDVIEGAWSPDAGAALRPRSAEADRLRGIFDATAPPAGDLEPTEELQRAATLLSSSRRPLLVLGGGARGTAGSAHRLAERLGALVMTTVNGKGTLSERHPLSLGASIRLKGTRQLFESADVLLVVGSEIGDSDLWGIPIHTQASVVRVDVDPHQLRKNLDATVTLCMDAGSAIEALLALLGGENGSAATAGTSSPMPRYRSRPMTWAGTAVNVRALLRDEALADGAAYEAINRELSAALPPETIVAGDSAQVSYFGTAHFWPMDRPGQFLYPAGYATLGYGLPSAIGARHACREAPVVVLVGDGGFLFSVQELLTAVEQRMPLPVVIVDNHGYAEIREGMEERGIEPIAVDRPEVDFVALSRAFGGRGHAVESVDELCARVVEALAADGPTVISIDVSSEPPR
jgi:thiamine pyrophosphate-dependent acetolactate synthase large subunit-like protein